MCGWGEEYGPSVLRVRHSDNKKCSSPLVGRCDLQSMTLARLFAPGRRHSVVANTSGNRWCFLIALFDRARFWHALAASDRIETGRVRVGYGLLCLDAPAIADRLRLGVGESLPRHQGRQRARLPAAAPVDLLDPTHNKENECDHENCSENAADIHGNLR